MWKHVDLLQTELSSVVEVVSSLARYILSFSMKNLYCSKFPLASFSSELNLDKII